MLHRIFTRSARFLHKQPSCCSKANPLEAMRGDQRWRSLDLGWGVPERPGRYPNVKSRVISALRTLDTGQFFSAVRASSSNLARSIPGTCARRVRADLEILKPSPSFSSETA